MKFIQNGILTKEGEDRVESLLSQYIEDNWNSDHDSAPQILAEQFVDSDDDAEELAEAIEIYLASFLGYQ